MDAGNLSGNDSTNCFYEANNFQGCGLADARPESFGLAFNQAGGGVYAMDWTSDHIAIWFWPRTSIPPNALSDTPDPLQWGKPVADFRGHCDIDSKFREHQIVRHRPILHLPLLMRARCLTRPSVATGLAIRGPRLPAPLLRRRVRSSWARTLTRSPKPTGRLNRFVSSPMRRSHNASGEIATAGGGMSRSCHGQTTNQLLFQRC